MSLVCWQGDIWKAWMDSKIQPLSVLAVTTNGIIKKNGRLVMGAGIALEAVKRYPDIDLHFAEHVRKHGNTPCFVECGRNEVLVSLPTKHHWRDKSDLDLIISSMKAIKEQLDEHPYRNTVFTGKPGCSCGGLEWNVVRLRIQEEFGPDGEPFIFFDKP